jgi:glycerol-3-phosphate dehydrogenase
MSADPVLAERVGGNQPVTRAEVEYAVREEMALTLVDFLERRSRLLLWDPDNGLAAAQGVARTMGAMLGWDAGRMRDEVATYRAHVESVKSFQGEEPEAARAAHA